MSSRPPADRDAWGADVIERFVREEITRKQCSLAPRRGRGVLLTLPGWLAACGGDDEEAQQTTTPEGYDQEGRPLHDGSERGTALARPDRSLRQRLDLGHLPDVRPTHDGQRGLERCLPVDRGKLGDLGRRHGLHVRHSTRREVPRRQPDDDRRRHFLARTSLRSQGLRLLVPVRSRRRRQGRRRRDRPDLPEGALHAVARQPQRLPRIDRAQGARRAGPRGVRAEPGRDRPLQAQGVRQGPACPAPEERELLEAGPPASSTRSSSRM